MSDPVDMPSTIFTTQSGSVYEVDPLRKRIRQLKGASTHHGGEWFDFTELDISPGRAALVLCPNDYFMRTSKVLSVQPCLN